MLISGCDDATSYSGQAFRLAIKYEREPNPVVELTTSAGTIKIELYEDRVPDTVDNFVELVEKKFL